MASVTLDKVTKRYGETTIVRDVDLKVQDKEFLVLVGPSGSGKSTTLRMVAGLEEITSGSIFIGDQRVNDVPPKDRDIAMVFQSYALYPHMTVFLMDEPLSNLDAKLRVQTRAELVKLQERLETTVMYVTHDQVEAMTMGHRIAVMNDARLQQVDTPQSIYEHPVNMFVAAFIGSPAMNFVRDRLVGTAESMRVETADFALDVPAARMASLQHLLGQEVILGIRPEHVTYQGPDVDGQQAVLRPRIEVVETLGHEAIVHLTIGATPLVARTPYERDLHAGMVLPFVVDMQRFHLFDPETERALT